MEKRTIGKFIAVLRKANGMTQKELGEKLFVSDKTVSRWERDECTPELSLIPAIAEIFGITTDELLCGQKNNPENTQASENRKNKTDKQMRLMLDTSRRKYNRLTLISVALMIFGLIAAMIANLGFSKGLIAFCLALGFSVAAEIFQIGIVIHTRLLDDEDDLSYAEQIRNTNSRFIKTAVTFTFWNIAFWSFCLPLVTEINGANFGLNFSYWLVYGFFYSIGALVIAYVLYTIFGRNYLCVHQHMTQSEAEKRRAVLNIKLFKKTAIVSGMIALVIGACIFALNVYGVHGFMETLVFDNCEDFKAKVEGDYDKWLQEGYSYVDEQGNVIVELPYIPDTPLPEDKLDEIAVEVYPSLQHGEIRDRNGNVICRYYHNPNLYYDIIFNMVAEDQMPVKVITNDAYYGAWNTFFGIQSFLYTLMALDFIISALVCVIKAWRRKTENI